MKQIDGFKVVQNAVVTSTASLYPVADQLPLALLVKGLAVPRIGIFRPLTLSLLTLGIERSSQEPWSY